MSSWWDSFATGIEWGLTGGTIANPVQSWLTSTAGSFAAAIEGGFIAFVKDLWDVILGPLEVITGAVLILIAVVFMVKDDLAGAGVLMGLLLWRRE